MSSGGGSSGTETRYTISPEQRALWNNVYPLFNQMISAGQSGQPLWNVPAMPTTPGAVLPTAGWMSNLGPEVQEGILQPYKLGEQQLMETLGGGGQLGSASGGFSGAGAAGLGKYWAEAAPTIGMTGWSMVAPELQRYGQQQYSGELQQRSDIMQAMQAPYQLIPSYLGGMSPYTSQGITTQPQNFWQTYGQDVMNIGSIASLAALK